MHHANVLRMLNIVRVLLIASALILARSMMQAQSAPPEASAEPLVEEGNGVQTSESHPEAGNPISVTVTGIVDGGGHDRYGVVVLRRGEWLLQNINWVDRTGMDAVSLLMAGRRFHLSRRLDMSVLAGPWYEYARRAWNEGVVDTNFQVHGEQFRFVCINHWGIALKSSGGFFDSHVQTVTGIPGLPRWLGASSQIEHSPTGTETLWAGPLIAKQIRDTWVGGVPYWDFLRHTAGFRLSVSYQMTLKRRARLP